MSSPFVPDANWLEHRVRRYVDNERARQDQRHGLDHDAELDLVDWLARIDRQRGQLADLQIAGGRFRGHDRTLAIKQLVQISALARRAAVFQLAEMLEARGEHEEDAVGEQFEPPQRTDSPMTPERKNAHEATGHVEAPPF